MNTPADAVFPIHAKTLSGLEPVLADELLALGAADLDVGHRLVTFSGDRRLLYRANLCCRAAIRFLKPLRTFPAASEQELYDGVREVDWRQHLNPDATLAIDPVVHSSFVTHSLYAAQLAKDAIVDQFRERTGQRPSVDRDRPTLRINLHLAHNQATVYLDSSGDSLHLRGYRIAQGDAPLNEVLAAGILRQSGWDRRSPLVDPMCGSGTFAIEAALLAANVAPGLLRKHYGFVRWRDYDHALHQQLLEEARQAQVLETPEIIGSDIDPQAIAAAIRNAEQAGVADRVRFTAAAFECCPLPAIPGTLVMNPPYDERMKVDRAAALYKRLGDGLKQRFAGFTAWVLTGNLDAAKQIGLRPSRKIKLFNASIECRLLKFDLYAGSKRGGAQAVETSPPRELELPREPEPAPVEPSPAPRPLVISEPQLVPPKWREQAGMFRNRLDRMGKHWHKWARRQGITCFRLYDRDIPDVPLAIDWYEGRLHISEYVRPHDRSEPEHRGWLDFILDTAAEALGVPRELVFAKRRERQRGLAQYERQDEQGDFCDVHEAGLTFRVNLTDYLDTGLFLDHRQTRGLVRAEATGKRFLNLFGYTGAFTVYAAAGGAASTTTVDLSNTYLDWARDNLRLNRFNGPTHQMVRDDALSFLRFRARRGEPPFDLAVVDPPTFSNSKKTEQDWDVQRDHAELLNLLLGQMTTGGKVFFSSNLKRFKLHAEEISGGVIRDISRQTVPADFRNKRIHQCWTIVKS